MEKPLLHVSQMCGFSPKLQRKNRIPCILMLELKESKNFHMFQKSKWYSSLKLITISQIVSFVFVLQRKVCLKLDRFSEIVCSKDFEVLQVLLRVSHGAKLVCCKNLLYFTFFDEL